MSPNPTDGPLYKITNDKHRHRQGKRQDPPIKLAEMTPLNIVIEEYRAESRIRCAWNNRSFAQHVANHIASYRTERNLTQHQLAEQLDLPCSKIVQLESGTTAPTLHTLAHITAGIGLEFHLLFADNTLRITKTNTAGGGPPRFRPAQTRRRKPRPGDNQKPATRPSRR